MIIRNCHKKYNLCRNDAAASPFGTYGSGASKSLLLRP